MSLKNELNNEISGFQREIVTLRNQLEEFEKNQEKRIDEIFCEFLTVIDTFERAELAIRSVRWTRMKPQRKQLTDSLMRRKRLCLF